MKYSHWYRKLFIRTETPEFNNTVIWHTNHDEITPEMVQKHWNLQWNWQLLCLNPSFVSLLIVMDDNNIPITAFGELRTESFRYFLNKIIEKCSNRQLFIKNIESYFRENFDSLGLFWIDRFVTCLTHPRHWRQVWEGISGERIPYKRLVDEIDSNSVEYSDFDGNSDANSYVSDWYG